MEFAEDIDLISDDIKEADKILRRVELLEKCIELNITTGKTMYM